MKNCKKIKVNSLTSWLFFVDFTHSFLFEKITRGLTWIFGGYLEWIPRARVPLNALKYLKYSFQKTLREVNVKQEEDKQ